MLKRVLIVILIILGFLVLRISYPFIYQKFINSEISNKESLPKVVAHRGFSGYTPENTLPAIEKALELGVDIIEIDIHLSKDGIPIVLHDFDLDRTTNASGPVSNYTFKELRSFRILNLEGNPTDDIIPSLEEVLQLINGKTELIIELKNPTTGKAGFKDDYYPDLARVTNEAVKNIKGESWCYILAFDGRYLEDINKLNPDLRLVKAFIGMWHSPVFSFYYDTKFHWGRYFAPRDLYAVLPYFKTLTRSQVEGWQKLNIEVWAYTINEKKEMATQVNLGIDVVVTDFPDQYKELIQ